MHQLQAATVCSLVVSCRLVFVLKTFNMSSSYGAIGATALLSVIPADVLTFKLDRDVEPSATIAIKNESSTPVAVKISHSKPAWCRLGPRYHAINTGGALNVSVLLMKYQNKFLRAEDGAGVVPDSSLHSIVIESCPLDQADYDAIMLPPLTLCASKFLRIWRKSFKKDRHCFTLNAAFKVNNTAAASQDGPLAPYVHADDDAATINPSSFLVHAEKATVAEAVNNSEAHSASRLTAKVISEHRIGRPGLETLPDDVLYWIFHEFLRGSLLDLRVVSLGWNELILRSIASYGMIGLKQLAIRVPENYCGKVALKLASKQIGPSGMPALCEAIRTTSRVGVLDLHGNHLGHEEIASLSKTLPLCANIVRLDLSLNQMGDEGSLVLCEFLRNNCTLTDLSLAQNCIGACGAHAICTALQTCQGLTTLNLSYALFGGLANHALGDLVRLSFSLKTLHLNDIWGLGICNSGVQALCEALKVNRTLTSLHLNHNKIGDAEMEFIGDMLQSNNTLTGLSVSQNIMGAAGIRSLCEALKSNKTISLIYSCLNKSRALVVEAWRDILMTNASLETLTLTQIYWSGTVMDAEAQLLCEGLKVNKTLTSLDVTGERLTDVGIAAFSRALEVNTTLSTLCFTSTAITAEGAHALSDMLKVNTSLRTLEIYGAYSEGFDDTCAAIVSGALKVNTSLNTLSIRKNRIGDEGAAALSEALKVNRTLKTLDLSANLIYPEGEQLLQEALKVNTYVSIESLKCKSFQRRGHSTTKMIGRGMKR